MERPKISFPVTAAIIVKAVSQVAALLDFSEQNTGTDFMNRSCRNKEEVILMNGNMVKTALYRAAADCIANLGGSHGPAEAVNNGPYIEFSKTVINQKEEQKKYLCVFPESFSCRRA